MHANKYKTTGKRSSSDKGGCGCCKPELARIYFAGSPCPDGAGRPAAYTGPGAKKRGRRGTIGGYWGGYSSLSSSPTHRALPGKVENLTPPATAKSTAWENSETVPPAAFRGAGPGQKITAAHSTAGRTTPHTARPACFFFSRSTPDALPDPQHIGHQRPH